MPVEIVGEFGTPGASRAWLNAWHLSDLPSTQTIPTYLCPH